MPPKALRDSVNRLSMPRYRPENYEGPISSSMLTINSGARSQIDISVFGARGKAAATIRNTVRVFVWRLTLQNS